MGITKTNHFNEKTNAVAEILKALGHPARLAILQLVASKSSCICNSIVSEIPLAQSTISRHLSELKRVGLIQGEIEGNNVCYCINKNTFAEVQSYLNLLLELKKPTENCC